MAQCAGCRAGRGSCGAAQGRRRRCVGTQARASICHGQELRPPGRGGWACGRTPRPVRSLRPAHTVHNAAACAHRERPINGGTAPSETSSTRAGWCPRSWSHLRAPGPAPSPPSACRPAQAAGRRGSQVAVGWRGGTVAAATARRCRRCSCGEGSGCLRAASALRSAQGGQSHAGSARHAQRGAALARVEMSVDSVAWKFPSCSASLGVAGVVNHWGRAGGGGARAACSACHAKSAAPAVVWWRPPCAPPPHAHPGASPAQAALTRVSSQSHSTGLAKV